MLFMVIERFESNNMLPVYERVKQNGRGLPDGLKYVNSWVEPNFARCFQLMECEDLRLERAGGQVSHVSSTWVPQPVRSDAKT